MSVPKRWQTSPSATTRACAPARCSPGRLALCSADGGRRDFREQKTSAASRLLWYLSRTGFHGDWVGNQNLQPYLANGCVGGLGWTSLAPRRQHG
jgi:hypothetical protein